MTLEMIVMRNGGIALAIGIVIFLFAQKWPDVWSKDLGIYLAAFGAITVSCYATISTVCDIVQWLWRLWK